MRMRGVSWLSPVGVIWDTTLARDARRVPLRPRAWDCLNIAVRDPEDTQKMEIGQRERESLAEQRPILDGQVDVILESLAGGLDQGELRAGKELPRRAVAGD